MTVKITVTDQGLIAESPYDAALPSEAKKLGGRYDPRTKAWKFDPRDEDRVRTLYRNIYGTDGTAVEGPTVTVRIPVEFGLVHRSERGEFRAAGRRFVYRPGRDSDVVYADGVVLHEGGFPGRGGSMQYPQLEPQPGTVIEVRDLDPGTAAKILAEISGAVRVDTDATADQQAALRAELAQILARAEEIRALLGEAA